MVAAPVILNWFFLLDATSRFSLLG